MNGDVSGRRTAIQPKRATREALAKRALTAALKTRRKLDLALHEAVCVYDAAQALGVEVRFDAIPSMEGMYIKQTLEGVAPHILVSAQRPTGRQAMTAAHELGHHVFGHGTHIDQYVKGLGTVGSAIGAVSVEPSATVPNFNSDEFLADTFGAFFLMPKSAVARGFAARGIAPARATQLEVFRVAGWLGVSYTAVVHHMCWSLNLITWARAQQLLTAKPKSLREQLIGHPFAADVYVVDQSWSGRPVDLKVGDVAIVPTGTTIEATTGPLSSAPRRAPGAITTTASGAAVLEATEVGIGRLHGNDWATFVRIAEREYVGRSQYRYLEAVDGDDEDDEEDLAAPPSEADRGMDDGLDE